MRILEKLHKDIQWIVKDVADLAQQEKIFVYLVGGIVRDLYLEVENLDLDFVVEGSGIDFAKKFARKHKGDFKAYYKFQTATVQIDSQRVDFAMARKEKYPKPGSYPIVSESTLLEDLKRRDFTMNAMAIQLQEGDSEKWIDPHGGCTDLDRKEIRALHPKSFLEDPTRILRGIRYEQRLGFKIEENTFKELCQALETGALETIPSQRLKQEVEKFLKEPNPDACLKRLQQLGGSAIINGF